MILTCPECGTQYVVKDGAIPPEGRQVRCAACKHSWHQEPNEMTPAFEAQAAAEASPGEPGTEDAETVAEATMIDPRSGPEAEERTYEAAVIEGDADAPAAAPEPPAAIETPAALEDPPSVEADAVAADWREPPTAEATSDEFSPFAGEDTDAGPRRRSPLATILAVAVAVVVLAALFWIFAPADLKAKLGIVSAGSTPLQLVTTHMDRQRLESGNELLTVTGRVINPTGKEQDVPPLQAQLRNKAGKVVYSWTIAPPARALPGGGSASFNSAEVNVPPGGDELTITLGQPGA